MYCLSAPDVMNRTAASFAPVAHIKEKGKFNLPITFDTIYKTT
jgi:hypothetical protein